MCGVLDYVRCGHAVRSPVLGCLLSGMYSTLGVQTIMCLVVLVLL